MVAQQSRVLLLPAVQRLLADLHTADQLRHRHPQIPRGLKSARSDKDKGFVRRTRSTSSGHG